MATYTDLFESEKINAYPDLFEIDMNNNTDTEKLPIKLFQEIERELLDSLVHTEDADSDDETDSPINSIKQVVESVREEFDSVVEEEDKKRFIHIFSKILATLLSVKIENIENVIKLVKLSVDNHKKMIRTKLVPKRTIRRWPPKECYGKFKIKTLLPEQETINIKKNGQVVRSITVRRKTKKFTGRWARNFLKCLHQTGKITEMVFKKVENKVKKRCFYCQKCKNYKTFQEYLKAFKQNGFWTFNKNVKNWNVYDPMWCKKNVYLKIIALK